MKVPKDNKNTRKILEVYKKEKVLQEIVIGKILGDCSISDTGNLQFCHSKKQAEYIEHCYQLFKNYTRSGIKEYKNKRNEKIHDILAFDTKAIFKKELVMFYKYDEINKKRIKIIPDNIEDLLTARGLAYWIMDDGFLSGKLVGICTHSFTLEEVKLLLNVINRKFNLNCEIRKQKIRDTDFYWNVLMINDLDKLWELIKNYIIPSMKYKLKK